MHWGGPAQRAALILRPGVAPPRTRFGALLQSTSPNLMHRSVRCRSSQRRPAPSTAQSSRGPTQRRAMSQFIQSLEGRRLFAAAFAAEQAQVVADAAAARAASPWPRRPSRPTLRRSRPTCASDDCDEPRRQPRAAQGAESRCRRQRENPAPRRPEPAHEIHRPGAEGGRDRQRPDAAARQRRS